jgi:hypothetical protein
MRVMLGRAGGGRAFVPQCPALGPQHLFLIPHLPPTPIGVNIRTISIVPAPFPSREAGHRE